MPLIVSFHHHLDEKFETDLIKLYQNEPKFPALQQNPLKKLNELLESEGYRFYSGIFNGKLVAGALALGCEGLTSFDCLCVREATRRRGVGTTLLEEIKAFEQARQVHALSCMIASDDNESLAFLKKNDFQQHPNQPEPGKLQMICELDPY